MFNKKYYQYCPWQDREHIWLEIPDQEGVTMTCMLCGQGARQNWLEEDE